MSGIYVEADVEVLLLAGQVVIRVGTREVVYDQYRPASASLAASLAMSAPFGLPREALEHVGNLNPGTAVVQQVRRVNADVLKVSGIDELIVRRDGKGGGYQMRVHPDRVDALRFIAMANSDETTHEAARTALQWWDGGPMTFRDGWLTAQINQVHPARVRLTRLSAGPRRVLIVDDQIAHTLAELLAAAGVDCTPVRNANEFAAHLPEVDGFALLLLDINLTPDGDYADQLGLKIADAVVRSGSKVPMLGMTYQLAPSADGLLAHTHSIIDRGLVEVIMKGSDDPESSAGHERVVERVLEMLDALPPGASSLRAIRDRLGEWEERAIDIERVTRAEPGDVKAREVAMTELRAMTSNPDSDLGDVRKRIRFFREVFLRVLR